MATDFFGRGNGFCGWGYAGGEVEEAAEEGACGGKGTVSFAHGLVGVLGERRAYALLGGRRLGCLYWALLMSR